MPLKVVLYARVSVETPPISLPAIATESVVKLAPTAL